MTNYLLKSLPPQSATIYGYLREKDAMSAKEIGKKLNILPHAVYRAVKPLTELGIVRELDTYPITFEARHSAEAVDMVSSTIRQNFQDTFISSHDELREERLDISFIKHRQDLLEKSNEDIKSAKNSVNFIVSGLEVPAETILVFKQAIERGVTINALVQNLNETSEQMFKNWKRIGVEVKYYPNMEARIFIIDGLIVYFTSYNPFQKEEGRGMRFNYIPYAKLMNEVFEQRWKVAKEI